MVYPEISLGYGTQVRQYILKPEPVIFPTFGFVKHWYQRYGYSYITQKRIESGNPSMYAGAAGDPEVFQLASDSSPVTLNAELEWFIYGLLVESSQGKLSEDQVKKAYKSTLDSRRASTNGSGTNIGLKSVVLNENLGAGMMRLNQTMFGGTTVKLLSNKVWRKGMYQYPIEVMNAQDPFTLGRTLKDDWWLMQQATNSTILPYPEGQVDPFPKLENSATTYDVIIPTLANNTTTGWIEAAWIEVLGNVVQPRYPYYRTWVSETQWKINRGL